MDQQLTKDLSAALIGLMLIGSIGCKSDVKPVVSTTEMSTPKQIEGLKSKTNDEAAILNVNKQPPQADTVQSVIRKTTKQVEKPKAKESKPSAPKPPKKKLKPKIVFEKIRHDFGEISQGDTVDYNFVFRNDGKAPLVINSCKVTCGCTQPSYPFIPIESGEEGYIGVRYVSVGKEGMQKPLITVFTNASKEPITLMMSGKVTLPSEDDTSIESPVDTTKNVPKKDTLSESK